MVCSRKLLVVSLMGVILTRITSAFARLADAYSYLGAAYPWQECKISISDYEDIFYGKFYDNIDNHDTFKDKTNLHPIEKQAAAERGSATKAISLLWAEY